MRLLFASIILVPLFCVNFSSLSIAESNEKFDEWTCDELHKNSQFWVNSAITAHRGEDFARENGFILRASIYAKVYEVFCKD